MRTSFIAALLEEARNRPDLFLVTADLGYSVLEKYSDAFPDQYLNCGVAEQNMTGMAAGLAHMGRTVFTYSIANFPTLRCFEQIRNDVCYHGLRVRVVAVGGGLAYSTQGYTHHGIEDVGVMRTLPGMTVIAPGDPIEADYATRALCTDEVPGPAYLRLGKAGEPRIHSGPIDFKIGRALQVTAGQDVTLITMGGTLALAVDAAELLRTRHGIRARVLSMHTVKPIDSKAVLAAARETGAIVTVEEHNIMSGLGMVVADVLAGNPEQRVPFAKYGLPDSLSYKLGDYSFSRDHAGELEAFVLKLLQQRATVA